MTLYEFSSSCSIFNFKIRLDNSISARGYTRLECKFAKPLPKATVLLLYASFDKTLGISHARAVDIIEE